MIDIPQFADMIVRPALVAINLDSEAAVELLVGTALKESDLRYLAQINGPALGLFQMEPATHDDIWKNFLSHRGTLAANIPGGAVGRKAEEMIGDLWYAAAMCRIHYFRVPDPLPEQGDYEAQAAYWKEHYNTVLGAGTEEDYLERWHLYCPRGL